MNKKVISISIMFTILFIFVSGCIEQPQNIPDRTERMDIYSLNRDIITSGQFLLGSGSIQSSPSYFFYEKLSSGGYKLQSIPASSCVIFYDENVTPYIMGKYRVTEGVVAPSELHYIPGAVSISLQYDTFGSGKSKFAWYDRVGDAEIHIPMGSFVQEYKP